MTAVRLSLLAVGIAGLVYLVATTGLETVVAPLQSLSWRLLVVVAFPFGVATAMDTLGWRFAFRQDLARFSTLFSARLAGEAFNATTPTAAVGGEPVKAYLLRPRVPLDAGLASVIVAKTTSVIAQGLFLVLGIALAFATLPQASPLLKGMTWLAAVEAVAVGGFVLVQQKGCFAGGLRFLRRLGFSGEQGDESARRLDGALAAFYRNHRGRLTLSILFHFGAWALGSLEVYLILRFMGISVAPTTALVIEAFAAAIKAAAFLIPAGLGAIEGGNMAIFGAFGLGGGVGLSVTLVRRLRELTWVVAGLIVLSAFRASSAGVGPAPQTSTR